MDLKLSWAKFKAIHTTVMFDIRFSEDDDEYIIYGTDGDILFTCYIEKTDPAGSDQSDFESNYKDDANRRTDGKVMVYSTPRPLTWETYFGGAGDDATNGIGEGPRLEFKLLSTDASKTVDITFNEDVRIKDGFFYSEGAPFGSVLTCEIVHPVAGVVGNYVKNAPVFGNAPIYFNSEDSALIQQGLTVRLIVENSDPTTYTDHDARTDFKVVGRLEMFRESVI